LKISFVFVTGYAAEVSVPAAFSNTPRLSKPCSSKALQEALQAALQRGSGAAAKD
jgi:hypothetical protein